MFSQFSQLASSGDVSNNQST